MEEVKKQVNETKEVEKIEKQNCYKLTEVTTQTGLAIETPEGKIINTEIALVDLLNLVKEIHEATA